MPNAAWKLEVKPTTLETEDSVEGKHVQASGMLVAPAKAKKLSQVPGRLWRWINPFAKDETAAVTETVYTHDYSSRAWATVVGWHPGESAFADPGTHESGMAFLTLRSPHKE
jgi:hypothetical protein